MVVTIELTEKELEILNEVYGADCYEEIQASLHMIINKLVEGE